MFGVCLQAKHSVGLMWWMLAREVLRLRGAISRDLPWDIMPDLYFYRDPEDVSLCLHCSAYYKWTVTWSVWLVQCVLPPKVRGSDCHCKLLPSTAWQLGIDY